MVYVRVGGLYSVFWAVWNIWRGNVSSGLIAGGSPSGQLLGQGVGHGLELGEAFLVLVVHLPHLVVFHAFSLSVASGCGVVSLAQALLLRWVRWHDGIFWRRIGRVLVKIISVNVGMSGLCLSFKIFLSVAGDTVQRLCEGLLRLVIWKWVGTMVV